MSDMIFGQRFVGMREPAWHGLGTVLTDQVTAQEAIKIGGIDFEYKSAPIGYDLPDGTFVSDGDRVAILRSPVKDDNVWRRLGFASANYTYLQNAELAEGLDAIAEKTGWKFETVGALGHGQTVFMTLSAGKRSVFGDEYDQFFIVSDGKVAGRALGITVAPVRVVCANTLAMAEQSATNHIRLPHNKSVASDFAFWLNLIGGLEKDRERAFKSLEMMAKRRIEDVDAKAIIAAAFPMPNRNQKARQSDALKDSVGLSDEVLASSLEALKTGDQSFEYWTRHAEKRRDAAFTLYERFNDGDEQGGKLPKRVLTKVQATPYAALQAVTELVDWSGRGKDEVIAASAIFGDGRKVKARAWSAALLSASRTDPVAIPILAQDAKPAELEVESA